MYEPNQFVMNCGVVDPSAGPIRFTSPVSRNLNDGDSSTSSSATPLLTLPSSIRLLCVTLSPSNNQFYF